MKTLALMKRTLLLICLCHAASAQALVPHNVLMDSQRLVIVASRDPLPPATGTLVTTGALYDGGTFARFVDEYGRSLFRVTPAGMIVDQRPPTLSKNPDTRRFAVRQLLRMLDGATIQLLAVERWQVDYPQLLDRSGEISSLQSQRSALAAKIAEALGQ